MFGRMPLRPPSTASSTPSTASFLAASSSDARRGLAGLQSSPASSSSSASHPSFVGASASVSSSARLVAAALQQDPNIFNYDEAVDTRTAATATHAESRAAAAGGVVRSADSGMGSTSAAGVGAARPASRYIESLVRAANEREKQRIIAQHTARQKEIEAEEEKKEFRGKEKFVTAAYKQLLSQHHNDTDQHTQHQQPKQQQQQHNQTIQQHPSRPVPPADAIEPVVSPPPDTRTPPVATADTEYAAVAEASSKRRRIESATRASSVDGSETRASGQRQPHSPPDAALIADTRTASDVILSSGGGSSEEADKRAAARARFLARKSAAVLTQTG